MAHHPVKVFLTIDKKLVTCPDCGEIPIKVGDTLTFTTPHGGLSIAWQENPFHEPVSVSGRPVNVQAAGRFSGTCSLTAPDGTPIPWDGGGIEGVTQTGDETANSTTR